VISRRAVLAPGAGRLVWFPRINIRVVWLEDAAARWGRKDMRDVRPFRDIASRR
jgi:hypothetical protein